MLVLAFDHSTGCLWWDVSAGDWSCALLLVVRGQHHPFGWELCSAGLAREGKAAPGTPCQEGESAVTSFTEDVALLGWMPSMRRGCVLRALRGCV